MQTNLPDLPFPNYGDAVLKPSGIHSAAKSGPRRHPRTDLRTLTPWTSFPNDIHNAISVATQAQSLPTTPFHIDCKTRDTAVENELRIHFHASAALHEPVEDVLKMLGVNGGFALPGGGNTAIIGDPDFSWVTSSVPMSHPKVIVEYKTWWAADLVNLVASFNRTHNDALSKQSLHALQQIYGYMTFNNNRFGILTNWRHAMFLRRAETADRKTLEYFLVELNRAGQPMSMLKAFVGMVLLAENDWFDSSPTPCSGPPNRNFGKSGAGWKERTEAFDVAEGYKMKPVDGGYQCLAIDFRICRFELSSARSGANGCTVTARLLRPSAAVNDLHVVCKVVDALRHPDAADSLNNEARAYAALQHLQAEVIPTLYGFYEVWGFLRFLALEPVGNAITEDEHIDQTLRANMKAALQRIHDARYIHGDIARRNFCRKDSGEVFLVDLETCQPCENQSDLDDEMGQVDGL